MTKTILETLGRKKDAIALAWVLGEYPPVAEKPSGEPVGHQANNSNDLGAKTDIEPAGVSAGSGTVEDDAVPREVSACIDRMVPSAEALLRKAGVEVPKALRAEA
ncbi:MAG TPA: hypothetical protein VN442_21730, partial [Bryobacteraceae bacterium]|nr:hypothetical protein [Bryobacteraceae bacterium]